MAQTGMFVHQARNEQSPRVKRVHNTFHPSRDPSTGWRCHSTGGIIVANQLRIPARLKRVVDVTQFTVTRNTHVNTVNTHSSLGRARRQQGGLQLGTRRGGKSCRRRVASLSGESLCQGSWSSLSHHPARVLIHPAPRHASRNRLVHDCAT